MHKFILFIKEFRIYKKQELLDAIASFSKSQFVIFISIALISIISMIFILAKVNNIFMVNVPTSGGTITEGIIGVPTLVNPVIALSDADKDLTALVYSGLMRKDPNGEFIPDLAESFNISNEGTTYTFKIKDNAKFHDGTKVTADDVIYTIEKIKDPIIKSPRRMSWDGVSINKKDDSTVIFTLVKPYISFLDNTTIGILPSSLWKNVNTNEFNLSTLNTTKAIGTGPYKISAVLKNNDGLPEKYELKKFNDFTLGKPLIKKINIISYANERDLIKALVNHSIDQAGGISAENTESIEKANYSIKTATLPRIFGIFFNSNNNKIFTDQAVLKALNIALDRKEIVDKVLGGYGSIINNPIPEKIISSSEDKQYQNGKIEEAKLILEKAGWKLGEDGIRTKGATTKIITKKVGGKNVRETVTDTSKVIRLSFSLITGDTPELKQTTTLIKNQLAQIGVEVDTQKIYETGPLNQLIRAREYEALFFGQIVNHESDLYSFWHSSQKVDPGLNIAMYTNKKVDGILEIVQKISNAEDRLTKYEDLSEEFNKTIPALLIYSPKYLYVTSTNLNNIIFDNINIPSDRFSSVYKWSANIEKVWKIFTK